MTKIRVVTLLHLSDDLFRSQGDWVYSYIGFFIIRSQGDWVYSYIGFFIFCSQGDWVYSYIGFFIFRSQGDWVYSDDSDEEEKHATAEEVFQIEPAIETTRDQPANIDVGAEVVDVKFHPSSNLIVAATLDSEVIW